MENIVYGKNVILEYLNNDDIEKIYIDKNFSDEFIMKKIKDTKFKYSFVPKQKLDSMTNNSNHQGVVAEISPYKYKEIEDIIDFAKGKDEIPLIIILDEVEDPHNLGSIIRTAEALGAHGIIIGERRAASVNHTVIKVSTGAIKNIPIVKVKNIHKCIKDLKKKHGIWISGMHMVADNNVSDIPSDIPIGLLMGGESKGLTEMMLSECDFIVKIPMKGKVNSLNVSQACTIGIYDIMRRR